MVLRNQPRWSRAANYHGPAVIVCADQTEIAVLVDLWTEQGGRGRGWRGEVRAAPGEEFAGVAGGQEAQLRLRDGRIGRFLPNRSSIASGRMMITGSGSEPF
ncbi:hypothetical protein Lfu02_00230 [Longispora fulva]|nr:hypothetical protein Lfu02_00230 [Longispora fulva]